MTKIVWDKIEDRRYVTGVDHGVLYPRDQYGDYPLGVPWNGLVSVNETPSGGESNKQYADNIVYLNLISAENFEGSIEAFYSPEEFDACDGSAQIAPGLSVGQQNRQTFGFVWRSLIGDAAVGTDLGYELHLVWGAIAGPSERNHATVNENPEAQTMSWDISTTPVDVPGFKPAAKFDVDSTTADPEALAALEDILFGTEGQDPRLPSPAEVMALFVDSVTEVVPQKPAYNETTKVLTIPTVTGVEYVIGGSVVAPGNRTLTVDTIVTARTKPGYKFPAVSDPDWLFEV